MVLSLDFHKAVKSRLWLSLPGSGPNFCKQRFKYHFRILKCLKRKNNYVEHLRKLVFGHMYVVQGFPLKNSIFFQR